MASVMFNRPNRPFCTIRLRIAQRTVLQVESLMRFS